MTAALGGGELAAEWVTLLPETATLAKKLREFKPRPIRVPVELDTDSMDRETRRGGRRSGRGIDTEIRRETQGTGRAVGDQVAEGLSHHGKVSDAAEAVGKSIRREIEDEVRKANLKTIAVSLFSGFGTAAAGAMQLVRNIGAIATVLRYAARAARGLSLSLLASATAARVLTGAGIAKFGTVLGFTAKQADKLAKTVARVTSAMLVAVAAAKFVQFLHTASKWMGVLTIGAGALTGILLASISVVAQWGAALVTALVSVGSALGIAAGAAVGLLGPAFAVTKIAFKGMSEGAKEFNKQFAETDELFNKDIGNRMGPLLTAVHDLKLGVTDAFTKAFQPAFGWLGGALQGLLPRAKGLATTMGNLGGEIAGTLNFKAASGQFDRLFDASDKFFQSFLGESGIAGVVGGLVDFATTAATTFSGVGEGINDTLLRFGKFLSGISGDQMKKVFQEIKNVATTVWAVVKPIIMGIGQLGDEMRTSLAPGVKAFGGGIADAIPGLVQMARILMPALSNVLEKLAPALPAIVAAFTPWAQILAVIAPVVADIITKLVPFAPIILAVAGAIKVATIALALYNTAMLIFTNAARIAKTVMWALNAAFVANPIGLVVVAIAAAAAGLALFFTKTEAGRKLWDEIWTGIKSTVTEVWNFIKVEGGKLWESLKPNLESLGRTAVDVFGQLKTAFQELWPKIEPVVAALARAWLQVQKFQFKALIETFKVLGTVIGWWATNVVVPAFTNAYNAAQTLGRVFKTVFDTIKTVVMFVWNNVLKPIFDLIAANWKVLWFAIQVGWEVGKKVFDAIGNVISAVWNGVLKPIFDAFGAAWDFLVEKLNWFGSVWQTVWEGLKTVVQAVWDFLQPVRDFMGDMFQKIGDMGKAAGDAIKAAWSGLTGILKSPLNAIGRFLQGLPDSVLGVEIPFVADLKSWGASLAGLKSGGIIHGPGTGTSDSILGLNQKGVPVARVSDGEGVVPAAVLDTPLGRYMFQALLGGLQGYATGGVPAKPRSDGLNPGAAWLSDYIKEHYGISNIGGYRGEDGYGEHSSGNALDIMTYDNTALGNQIAGFLKANKDTLGLDGMIWNRKSYGYGGSWDGKPYTGSHPHDDHIHAILGEGRGVGAAAVGLPSGPLIDPVSGRNITGGSTAAGSASSYSTGGGYVVDPKKVREAEDRVTDRTNSLENAEMRLAEYEAKIAEGKTVNESTLQAARDRVDKAKRELEQAQEDLETSKQGTWKEGKAPKGSAEGGSDDWGSVGGMIFNGFLESMGFDGSVFKNLFETPNVKSAMAGLNWGLGMLFPGEDAAAGAPQDLGLGGGGGSGSGILGFGAEMLAGAGEQAGLAFPAAHGDQALAGGTPGPGNVFDLRGSQLGVSPGAFDDKMGEMTAASKRHPTLGP